MPTSSRGQDFRLRLVAVDGNRVAQEFQSLGAQGEAAFQRLQRSTAGTTGEMRQASDQTLEMRNRVRNLASNVAILDGPLGGIASRFNAFATAVGRGGLALTAVLAATTAYGFAVSALTRALSDAERAQLRLQGVINAQGTLGAGVDVAGINRVALDTARATLASQAEVEEAAAFLIPSVQNEEEFERIIVLAQDMAEIFNETLPASARVLAKALEAPSTAIESLRARNVSLSQALIDQIREFEDLGREAEGAALIFTELERRFGGAGEAAAQGLAGQFDAVLVEGARLIRMFQRIRDTSNSVISGVIDALLGLPVTLKIAETAAKALGNALESIGDSFNARPLADRFETIDREIDAARERMEEIRDNPLIPQTDFRATEALRIEQEALNALLQERNRLLNEAERAERGDLARATARNIEERQREAAELKKVIDATEAAIQELETEALPRNLRVFQEKVLPSISSLLPEIDLKIDADVTEVRKRFEELRAAGESIPEPIEEAFRRLNDITGTLLTQEAATQAERARRDAAEAATRRLAEAEREAARIARQQARAIDEALSTALARSIGQTLPENLRILQRSILPALEPVLEQLEIPVDINARDFLATIEEMKAAGRELPAVLTEALTTFDQVTGALLTAEAQKQEERAREELNTVLRLREEERRARGEDLLDRFVPGRALGAEVAEINATIEGLRGQVPDEQLNLVQRRAFAELQNLPPVIQDVSSDFNRATDSAINFFVQASSGAAELNDALEILADTLRNIAASLLQEVIGRPIQQLVGELGAGVSGAQTSSTQELQIFSPTHFATRGQHGLDFIVGGSGGVDSQPVAFMSTPGSRVIEMPRNQQNAAGALNATFVIEAPGADAATAARLEAAADRITRQSVRMSMAAMHDAASRNPRSIRTFQG